MGYGSINVPGSADVKAGVIPIVEIDSAVKSELYYTCYANVPNLDIRPGTIFVVLLTSDNLTNKSGSVNYGYHVQLSINGETGFFALRNMNRNNSNDMIENECIDATSPYLVFYDGGNYICLSGHLNNSK